MQLFRSTLTATAALVLVAGCSQDAETAENQQQPGADATMADPSNPYAQAEMQMMERQKQLQEAEDLERLLRGEQAPAAASSADARPAPAPAEVPQPAAQPKAASEAPEASKEPAADPHAGHDMSNMSH